MVWFSLQSLSEVAHTPGMRGVKGTHACCALVATTVCSYWLNSKIINVLGSVPRLTRSQCLTNLRYPLVYVRPDLEVYAVRRYVVPRAGAPLHQSVLEPTQDPPTSRTCTSPESIISLSLSTPRHHCSPSGTHTIHTHNYLLPPLPSPRAFSPVPRCSVRRAWTSGARQRQRGAVDVSLPTA